MIDINVKIGGEAGYGILSTGLMFSKVLSSSGFHVFGYPEYPSLIRGGFNSFFLRFSTKHVSGPKKGVDILLAFNQESIDRNLEYLDENTVVIYDPDETKQLPFINSANLVPVPFKTLAKLQGDLLYRNTIGLAALLSVIGIPEGRLIETIENEYSGKKQDIIYQNIVAARTGYSRAASRRVVHPTDLKKSSNSFVLSGNEAMGISAIASGLLFSAIYPMTPVHNLEVFLKKYEDKFDYQIVQPNDEIEGINMAIGASYSGKRAMVATSGGGFSLMVEALGLSAETETPLVIILGSRPGPSTGLPTWTDQADLRFAMHASQGEFPRIIFTPGDWPELIEFTSKAFDFAERYQLPVFILVDKFLCESHSDITITEIENNIVPYTPPQKISTNLVLFDDFFPRYLNTENGISERPLPIINREIFKVSSDEHNEYGFIDEGTNNRKMMMEKRDRKLKNAQKEIKGFSTYGDENPETLIVCWGSNKGVVKEAVELLSEMKINVGFLHYNCVSPFPKTDTESILKNAKTIVVIENNFSGQLSGLIREKTGVEINSFLKYDGRPFFAEEIVEYIKSL